MCLILFAYEMHPDFPLIIVANRDEYFARPSAVANFWHGSEAPILAGRDLQAGGTWFGVTRTGRFASVTNIRGFRQTKNQTKSRGELVRNFLNVTSTPKQYCEAIKPNFPEFSGFNLLVGDNDSLCYANNSQNIVSVLESGIFGLSNGLLDSDWPKVNLGKKRLKNLINQGYPPSSDSLISIMTDRLSASDDELPDTGLSIDTERILSATFIQHKENNYGTRCSTALVIERPGNVRFCEQTYNEFGQTSNAQYFEFWSEPS
ncbi:MAG: hypothetical protein CMD92_04030 [Gammaproteobacteria bacterium]|nr:hypothetical protein [Gammaproteobacteria bacterium]HBW82983.1 hypothetical protein [Gammaproteobacteria bacterium]